MATVTYTCKFSSELAFNAHPSASLSGPSATIPDGALITNVNFEVYCGVSTYNYEADTCATLTDSDGNTFDVDSSCDTGSESRIWASWDESVNETESASMDWNNLETIELSGTNKLTVRTGYTATLTIEYVTATECEAPTTVSIKYSRTSAATNVLSWSGAKAGMNNAIRGYFVQYSDSSDGVTWGGWGEEGTKLTSATSSSMTVSMPAANKYRKYRVWTLGTASDGDWGTLDSLSATESSATYRMDISIEGFSDDPLTAGMYVKALHMTELQDRVNTLRGYYNLSAYNFSTITAGASLLADWSKHVSEIRTALDAVYAADGRNHSAWISLSANCPRADVIEQLRAAVLAL